MVDAMNAMKLNRGSSGRELSLTTLDSDDSDEDSDDDEGDFAYRFVSCCAVLVCAFGVVQYLLLTPEAGLSRTFVGTGLLITGIFIAMQNDLLVTWWRMRRQMTAFRQNNDDFEEHLTEEVTRVEDLKKVADAFDTLQTKFNGSLKAMDRRLEEMKYSSRSEVKEVAGLLVRLYGDRDNDHRLELAQELDLSLEALNLAFASICPDIKQRTFKLKQVVLNNPKIKKNTAMSVDFFAELVEKAVNAKDLSTVVQEVQQTLDTKSDEYLKFKGKAVKKRDTIKKRDGGCSMQ